jgi:hypothetical protein
MANIFISHSSRNSDRAIEVRNWLAANGWDDVFLDLDAERGIVAGQRWKEALQKAAHRCEVVLALVSPEWLASGWCKSEIDAARLMGKKIIVALIGVEKSLVPLDLSDEQWITYLQGAGATVLELQTDFIAGRSILAQIEEAASRCNAGIFLFTKDDDLVDKGQPDISAPRDNVVFEAGYFIGLKGKRNVLIVREKGSRCRPIWAETSMRCSRIGLI